MNAIFHYSPPPPASYSCSRSNISIFWCVEFGSPEKLAKARAKKVARVARFGTRCLRRNSNTWKKFPQKWWKQTLQIKMLPFEIGKNDGQFESENNRCTKNPTPYETSASSLSPRNDEHRQFVLQSIITTYYLRKISVPFRRCKQISLNVSARHATNEKRRMQIVYYTHSHRAYKPLALLRNLVVYTFSLPTSRSSIKCNVRNSDFVRYSLSLHPFDVVSLQ